MVGIGLNLPEWDTLDTATAGRLTDVALGHNPEIPRTGLEPCFAPASRIRLEPGV